jgi:hypothetical protein
MDNKKGKKFNKFNIKDNKRDGVGFNFSTHKSKYNDINST